MRTAEIDGLIPRSPCIGIELPAETTREEMHFLTPAQVGTLAGAIGERYSCAVYTAAYTGLRAGELWALRLGHVDLRKRTLSVLESLSEVRGELVVGPTKTRTRRTVTLPNFR
jgi:integrase